MGDEKSEARNRKAWALAKRQHGLLTRKNLAALGFSPKSIKHRTHNGRLFRISRGVYAVGWPELTPERRWMAAVLACGDGAALSHRSAAALWKIGEELDSRIDVTVRRRHQSRRRGLKVRSRPSLPAVDITERKGIPVTRPARTLLDLATELNRETLERAVNEADKRDLVDPVRLRQELERYTGEPGVRTLRRLLDRHTFRLSDSDLERLFRPIARAAGLPVPCTKVRVNGFEVDFFWPELGLLIETDGLRYHRTPLAQARDRLRDQTHTAAGLTPLRFTHWQVKHEDSYVRSILEGTVATLRRSKSAFRPP